MNYDAEGNFKKESRAAKKRRYTKELKAENAKNKKLYSQLKGLNSMSDEWERKLDECRLSDVAVYELEQRITFLSQGKGHMGDPIGTTPVPDGV